MSNSVNEFWPGFFSGLILTFLIVMLGVIIWDITRTHIIPRQYDVVKVMHPKYIEMESGVIIYSSPIPGMFPGDTINHFYIHGKVH